MAFQLFLFTKNMLFSYKMNNTHPICELFVKQSAKMLFLPSKL